MAIPLGPESVGSSIENPSHEIRRESWIDCAKGIAIVLVVLFHSVMYLNIAGASYSWIRFTYTLDTFRMPLFFFMSGLVATRLIEQSFPYIFRKRILTLLYLYVLWCTVQLIYLSAFPEIRPDGTHSPARLLLIFFIPNANLWFLYALSLFYVVARLTRSLPAIWVLVASAVLAAAFGSGLLGITDGPWAKTGRYLFFFLVAVRIGAVIREMVPRVRRVHVLLFGGVYACVLAVLTFTGARSLPFAVLFGGLVAVVFGISLSVQISKFRIFGFVRFLGTRTLPIYVVHTLPMIAASAALIPFAPSLTPLTQALLPPVLALASIVISLLCYGLFHRIPGIFSFPIPAWTNPGRKS